MMNSRQMGVVESLIWLVVVLCASVLAMGVFLLISILGVAMLLAGMASQAVHSIFGGSPQRRVIFQHHSQGQYSQRPETRATIVEGEVLRRPK